jgi:6-phosphogluconate dehydrogenase
MELGMIGLGRTGTNMVPAAVVGNPHLSQFAGHVSDSKDGRWTIAAAIDESIPAPAPVLSAALYEPFSSRGEDDFADKFLSALLYQFGGHQEKPAAAKADA